MKQWQIPTSNVVSYKTIATGAIVHAARNRSKYVNRRKHEARRIIRELYRVRPKNDGVDLMI
jgi:hypothetical protein